MNQAQIRGNNMHQSWFIVLWNAYHLRTQRQSCHTLLDKLSLTNDRWAIIHFQIIHRLGFCEQVTDWHLCFDAAVHFLWKQLHKCMRNGGCLGEWLVIMSLQNIKLVSYELVPGSRRRNYWSHSIVKACNWNHLVKCHTDLMALYGIASIFLIGMIYKTMKEPFACRRTSASTPFRSPIYSCSNGRRSIYLAA